MIIAFTTRTRLIAGTALEMFEKGVEAAKTAEAKVYLSTTAAEVALEQIGVTREWLFATVDTALDDAVVGEEREVLVPTVASLTLRTACSVYLAQLSKLKEKEQGLLVETDATDERISDATSLADRLAGQTELEGMIARGEVEVSAVHEKGNLHVTIRDRVPASAMAAHASTDGQE